MIQFASCDSLPVRGVSITFSDSFHLNLESVINFGKSRLNDKSFAIEKMMVYKTHHLYENVTNTMKKAHISLLMKHQLRMITNWFCPCTAATNYVWQLTPNTIFCYSVSENHRLKMQLYLTSYIKYSSYTA